MRRVAAGALMCAAVLAVTACGDDDEPAVASSTTAASSTTTASTTTATSTTASSTTATAAVTRDCGQVGFTPNSEDVAGDITATGVTCDEALAFVELAGRRTSSGGPPSVDVEGWRCVVTYQTEDPLPRSDYRCTRGSATVTFGRS